MNDDHSAPQPSERGLAKGDPWIVYVDVYLKSTKPGDFEIKSCLPTQKHTPPGSKEEDYLVFENNLRPGFRIFFQLHDRTGAEPAYRFPTRDEDAVWSQYGDVCPAANSPENNAFKSPKVQAHDPTILLVRYKNETDPPGGRPGRFRYTLNVTTDGERPYLALDPGGIGANGPSLRL